jgi:uncharacterized membrane protein
MRNLSLKSWLRIAMIAAIYTALSLALAPFSFGNIQVRVSEALTVLAIFSPLAIFGLSLGCFITNFLGVILGFNPLGLLDVFVGTLATFIAAVLSYRFRDLRIKGFPFLSFLMPVLINALFIGFELTLVFAPALDFRYFLIFAFEVGLGQTLAVFGLGSAVYHLFKRHAQILMD